MKKKYLLLFALWSSFSVQAAEFDFRGPNQLKPANLGLNAYFYFHNIYEYVFKPIGLDTFLTREESSNAMITISNLISFEHPIYMVVGKFKDNNKLVLSFKLNKQKEESVLIVNSNYIVSENRFTTEYIGKEFGTIFYVNKNKLTYYRHQFDPNKEEILKKNGNKLALAEYYLHNDNFDDDKLVMPALDDVIKDPKIRPYEKYLAILTKGQISLILNDIDKANGIWQGAAREVKNNGEDNAQAEIVLGIFKNELELMKLAVKTLSSPKSKEESKQP